MAKEEARHGNRTEPDRAKEDIRQGNRTEAGRAKTRREREEIRRGKAEKCVLVLPNGFFFVNCTEL